MKSLLVLFLSLFCFLAIAATPVHAQSCENTVRINSTCRQLGTTDICGNAVCDCQFQGTFSDNTGSCFINRDVPCSTTPQSCGSPRPTCVNPSNGKDCAAPPGRIGNTSYFNVTCGGGSLCTSLDNNGCGGCEAWTKPACNTSGICETVACESTQDPFCGRASNACNAPGWPGCAQPTARPNPPEVQLYLNGDPNTTSLIVPNNTPITIGYNVENATACQTWGEWFDNVTPNSSGHASGSVGKGPLFGPYTARYFLRCRNAVGDIDEKMVQVEVLPPPPIITGTMYKCAPAGNCVADTTGSFRDDPTCGGTCPGITQTPPPGTPPTCSVDAPTTCSPSGCTVNLSSMAGRNRVNWYLNGAFIAATSGPSYNFTGLNNSTSYSVSAEVWDDKPTGAYPSLSCGEDRFTTTGPGGPGGTPPPATCTPPAPACGTTTYCTDSSGRTHSRVGSACNGESVIFARFWNQDGVTPYSGSQNISLLSNAYTGAARNHNTYFYAPNTYHDTAETIDICEVSARHPSKDPGMMIDLDSNFNGCPPNNLNAPGTGETVTEHCSYREDRGESSCQTPFGDCRNGTGTVSCSQPDPDTSICDCEMTGFQNDDYCAKGVDGLPNSYPVCFAANTIPVTITRAAPVFQRDDAGTFDELRNQRQYGFSFAAPRGTKLKVVKVCDGADCSQYNDWVGNPSGFPNRGVVLKDWDSLVRGDVPTMGPNYWQIGMNRIDTSVFTLGYDIFVQGAGTSPIVLSQATSTCSATNLPINSLSWTAINPTNYLVYRSDNGAAPQLVATLPGSQTTYVDPTAGQSVGAPANSIPYSYFIRAVSASFVTDSNYTSIINNCMGTQPPPTVPTISATCTCTTGSSAPQATVAWSPSSGVHHYRLYRDGGIINSSLSSNSYIDPGLTSGTSYTYQVDACNAANVCGARSNSFTTNACNVCDSTGPTVTLPQITCVVPDHLQDPGGSARASAIWSGMQPIYAEARDAESGVSNVQFYLTNVASPAHPVADSRPLFINSTPNNNGLITSPTTPNPPPPTPSTIYHGWFGFTMDSLNFTTVTPPSNRYTLSAVATDFANNQGVKASVTFDVDSTCRCAHITTKEGDVHANDTITVCDD